MHLMSICLLLDLSLMYVKILVQNDISDILDLTFSVDADEEKLILYEKGEVRILILTTSM